ncbi:MAG TPA: deoxyguanosinetriphosphate triphosphohydrolase [Chthoniobacterales bacterium]
MLRTRAQLEEEEEQRLAPYAWKAAHSIARKHAEDPHPFLTNYQRDTARIIHSAAFRRLEYKTQVFLSGTGDRLRTRLTHTMEVVSISRMIARALMLNEDLTEAIALAHDLGHAPFGFPGEEMLNGLMEDFGGFEHNAQSLRIVQLLEPAFPNFNGLNLSAEVLDGLRKHEAFRPGVKCEHSPSLEAQIVGVADDIACFSHDLDDGLEAGLLQPEQLETLTLWAQAAVDFSPATSEACHSRMVRRLVTKLIADVIESSSELIDAAELKSVADVSSRTKPLIAHSTSVGKAATQLRKFLHQNLYSHPKVEDMNQKACAMLKNVFDAYVSCPSLLEKSCFSRIKKEGLQRTVCDYLSGMTDRSLMEEHKHLFLQEGMVRALRGTREVFTRRLKE